MGRLPPRAPVADSRFNRTHRAQAASRGLLLVMAALILFMPMSYRAGTAFSHPHAFFQVFIDAATGHSHHDADELLDGAPPDHAGAFSPFVPPDVPLQQPHGANGVRYRAVDGHILFTVLAHDRGPDTPTLSALTAPLEQATVIPALSLIVLLLLAADRRRAIWALTRIPQETVLTPEPPPPRHRAR